MGYSGPEAERIEDEFDGFVRCHVTPFHLLPVHRYRNQFEAGFTSAVEQFEVEGETRFHQDRFMVLEEGVGYYFESALGVLNGQTKEDFDQNAKKGSGQLAQEMALHPGIGILDAAAGKQFAGGLRVVGYPAQDTHHLIRADRSVSVGKCQKFLFFRVGPAPVYGLPLAPIGIEMEHGQKKGKPFAVKLHEIPVLLPVVTIGTVVYRKDPDLKAGFIDGPAKSGQKPGQSVPFVVAGEGEKK